MSRHLRVRASVIPVAVAIVAVAVASACAVSTRAVVSHQEARLLQRSAGEATSILSNVFVAEEASLRVLNGVTESPSQQALEHYADRAGPLGGTTVALWTLVDGPSGFATGPVRIGTPPAAVDAVRTALAERSRATHRMATGIVRDAGGTRLVVALAGDAGHPWVTLHETRISPETPFPLTKGSPFSELRGSIYTGADARSDSLVLTTETHPRMDDRALRLVFPVGANEFVMFALPRHHLVGNFAHALPWMVFAGALLVGLLATLTAHILGRRSAFALRLVDERTAELTRAIEAQGEALELAAAANRAKNNFLSRVSHEFRTPLNAVLGFGQLLEVDAETDEDREAIGYIIAAGNHLLHLINQVLDLSSLDAGSLALITEEVDPDPLVRDCVNLVRPIATAAGVDLSVDPGAPGSVVCADAQRVTQVVLNLLSNAIKFNRPGGSVTVAVAAPTPEVVTIAVRDTGAGLEPSQIDQLFVPFERLGAERTAVEGVGLGLALARQLARAMQGDVTVTSDYGRGCTFTLLLPGGVGEPSAA